MNSVDISGIPRLTNPKKLFDLRHFSKAILILIVQEVVLLLERMKLLVDSLLLMSGAELVKLA